MKNSFEALMKITCPNCETEIALGEAVSHRIREQLAAEFNQKLQEREASFAKREVELSSAAAKVEKARNDVQTEIERRLIAERQKIVADSQRQAQEKLGLEMADLQTRVEGQRERLKQAEQAELELRKKQREVEHEKANLQLELARETRCLDHGPPVALRPQV